MEFSALAKYRQSIRNYIDKTVEKEKIIQCLETARLSPSANNAQPWKFIVVDESKLKNEVASAVSAGGMNKFAAQAPVIIAVVLEKRDIVSSVASVLQNKEYSLIDVGIAVNQFCLQAEALGLGTCIIGWFNERKIKKLLQIPRTKRLPLVITMGYSDVPVRKKTRKPFEKMSSWNGY